jgi:RNA polymerase sigma-70 factor (ECF subfamily)
MVPGLPEVDGLLALMLLTDARRVARVDGDGLPVPLAEQDRDLWDGERIAEGLALSERAAAHGPAGPYTVQARIAAVHAEASRPEETDWARVVRLYEWLERLAPGPVVELNRAAAIAMSEGPGRALEMIDEIEGLDGYGPLHAARADLLGRLGRDSEAAVAYGRAIVLSANPAVGRYLERRSAELGAGPR